MPDNWTSLILPAIAPGDVEVPVWDGVYSRKAGEALSPREPVELLRRMQVEIGSDAFSAQYQQEPVPPGGAMIKRAWVRQYSELPPWGASYGVQSWDTANKGGPNNDWSVCTSWRVDRKRNWYLADVWRDRVDYPELRAKVHSHAASWKPRRVLVEDAGTGTGLLQELKGKVQGLRGVRPNGDKISRMSIASAKFEAGRVFFPKSAPWLADLEAELFAFPGGRHDDQCDSISQALQEEGRGGIISQEGFDAAMRASWGGNHDPFGSPYLLPVRIR